MDHLINDTSHYIIFPWLQHYSPTIDDPKIFKQIKNISNEDKRRKEIYRYLQSFVFYFVIKRRRTTDTLYYTIRKTYSREIIKIL
jgi:hypothetical protein